MFRKKLTLKAINEKQGDSGKVSVAGAANATQPPRIRDLTSPSMITRLAIAFLPAGDRL
jgi:hypothetical protein